MRASGYARFGVVLALCLASCEGCEEEETPPTTTAAPSGDRHLVAGVPVGTIEGTVRLAEDEEVPSYLQSPFDSATAGQLPATCTPPRGSDRRPLTMDEQRGLMNIAVTATGDPEHWLPEGEPVVHEVHIHDCRLEPVTLTATTGDTLRVINETNYPFMPELGLGMLQAVLPSDPLDATLDRAGAHAIDCAFAAPCGRMQVLVFRHPVHTVTTAGGHFRIENAPADQELTISALHALVDGASAITRVTEGGTAHVDIVVHRALTLTLAPPPTGTTYAPGTQIDPGSPHGVEMTQEEIDRLRALARQLEAEGTPPPPSTPQPSSTPPPPSTPPSSAPPPSVPQPPAATS